MSAPIALLLIRLHENKIRTHSPRVHPFVRRICARLAPRAPHVYGRHQARAAAQSKGALGNVPQYPSQRIP
jgi:hypothetical protein